MRFQQIGQAIQDNVETIVSSWSDLALEEQPDAAHRELLRNSLPEFLQALGGDLAESRSERTARGKLLARDHGEQRWEAGWQLEALVRDYQLMQIAILRLLDDTLPDPLTLTEILAVGVSMDDAIASAVTTFAAHEEAQRREADRTRARLAAIVNSSRDAIIGQQPDGTIVSWNVGAETIYRYSADEATGKNISMIVPASRRPEMEVILAAARGGKSTEQLDTFRIRKDGVEIPVSLTVSPIFDGQQRVVGVATIERDITERVRASAALADAKDSAEAANSAKSQFLANVSHELRTPMNAIVGMTQLALEEDITEELRDYLNTTKESADTLLDLLNDVLDISKLESGGFDLEQRPFSLSATLNETMKAVAYRAYEKGLETACHIPADIPDALVGDALRLRQVVTNLLNNAIKFTTAGEIVVDVKVASETAKHVLLKMSVSDTGIGIREQDQERIFAPFTQVDATSTRDYSGAGLGLSIAAHLIDRMKGNIWVESEMGVGTTFHFTLRFRRDGKPASRKKSESDHVVEHLRGLPVLVVDDNATNRAIMEESLHNWSMRPVLAEDADMALDELRKAESAGRPFRVLIVDALMPDVDGFEFIERSNRDSADHRATILMLSTADRTAFKDRLRELAVDAMLDKPVSQSNLLDAVTSALGIAQLDPSEESHLRDGDTTSRPLRVLLAEDTPANCKVVERVLTKRGHSVEVAHNGREAVECMRRDEFDVVLMDIQMPIMDGFQATASIRAMEEPLGRRTPIVAMTAHAMRGDAERCLAAGMDAYLSKPIDVRKLLRTTHRLAAGTKSAAGAVAQPIEDEDEDEEQAAHSDSDAVVDFDAALQRLGGDDSLLNDLADFYVDDHPGLLAAARAAIDDRDAAALERAAHSLKGLAANFGADRAQQTAAVMEDHADKQDFAAAAASLKKMVTEFDRLTKEISLFQFERSAK